MDRAVDVLRDEDGILILGGDHVKNENTHGSGCTLASAIAAQLASGRPLREAAMLAKAYVTKAIAHGFSIGKGLDRWTISIASTTNHPLAVYTKSRNTGMHPASDPASR